MRHDSNEQGGTLTVQHKRNDSPLGSVGSRYHGGRLGPLKDLRKYQPGQFDVIQKASLQEMWDSLNFKKLMVIEFMVKGAEELLVNFLKVNTDTSEQTVEQVAAALEVTQAIVAITAVVKMIKENTLPIDKQTAMVGYTCLQYTKAVAKVGALIHADEVKPLFKTLDYSASCLQIALAAYMYWRST